MLVTLALWALLAFAGADLAWAELLRFLPYPVYLVPPLLALAASWFLRWPWRLAALAAVLLTLTATMDLRWGGADSGSGALRVMTWNAKAYGEQANIVDRDHKLAWEILEHDPDVVVLQDADAFARRDGGALPEPVAAVLRGRTVFTHDQYVVASRLPLRDCRAAPMPYRGKARDYVRCTLTASGVDIELVTAHFASPRKGLNATRQQKLGGLDDWEQNYRDRLTQAEALVHALAGSTRPVIVAGDLNAVESSPVVGALKAISLRDAFASAGRGYGYTHGHAFRYGFSFLRIDHILVSPQIGVRRSFVGPSEASEHKPVIADLLVRRD